MWKNPEKDYNYLSSPLKEEREAWALRDGKQVNATDYSGLCLWGDEAPCFNTGGSLFIFLWSLLGVIDLTRHWICCFPKSLIFKRGCKDRHTYDSVLKVIVWMIVCALSDDPPELRHDGIPFSQSPYKGDKARAARYASKRKISRCCILKKKRWLVSPQAGVWSARLEGNGCPTAHVLLLLRLLGWRKHCARCKFRRQLAQCSVSIERRIHGDAPPWCRVCIRAVQPAWLHIYDVHFRPYAHCGPGDHASDPREYHFRVDFRDGRHNRAAWRCHR